MIGRLWRTGLQPGRGEAYEHFAREVSLPMFREQDGFLGCLMSRTAESGLVFTLWRDHAAIEALDHSPSYRATVTQILEAVLLAKPQSLEVTEVHLVDLAALSATAQQRRCHLSMPMFRSIDFFFFMAAFIPTSP